MSQLSTNLRAGVAALALAGVLGVPALASAQTNVPLPPPSQSAGQPDMDYPDGGPQDQGYGPDQSYAQGPGGAYDNNMPPPQAHNGPMRPEDRAYAAKYHAWQQERAAYDQYQYGRCVQHRQGAAVAGAILGGIAGAVIGSNVAGRYDRTEGAVAGGALGAVAGGAIGSTAGSNNCPPGYGYGPAYGHGYGPGYVGPAYGPGYGYGYGGPVVVGAPVVGVGIGYGYAPYGYYRPYRPYRGYRHGYWRRW